VLFSWENEMNELREAADDLVGRKRTTNKTSRPIRINGDVAYMPLTKGYKAVIDAADVHLVEGWSWHAVIRPKTVYAKRIDYSGDKKRVVSLHRVILAAPSNMQVDHINSDGLNNQRCNLRLATSQQNTHNTRARSDNTSGFKGVSLRKRTGKWQAHIKFDGKSRYLGYYTTAELAYAAYCVASTEMHGVFGRAA
jgi:hypothetical protein